MQDSIRVYFAESEINITAGQMNKMVGPNSMMRQIINMLKINLLNVTCSDDCTNTTTTVDRVALAQVQWGSASVLNNASLLIMGLDAIDSVDSDLFVQNIFATQPEFGYYLSHNYMGNSESKLNLDVS